MSWEEREENWEDDFEDDALEESLDASDIAWREVEAEASFNRALLLGARDLWWTALQTPRSGLTPLPMSKQKQRLVKNAIVIKDAYRYLYNKVQEMLDE